MKTERFLKTLKILRRNGEHFGVEAKCVRVSMLDREETFNVFIERLASLRGCLVARKWEIGGSLLYLSKYQKRKIRKSLFLLSFLFYTTISSLQECYS